MKKEQHRSRERELASYRRNASAVTDEPVLPPAPSPKRPWTRKKHLPASGDALLAGSEAAQVLDAFAVGIDPLRASLASLAAMKRPGLLGKVEEAQMHADKALEKLDEARSALEVGDFGRCGKAVSEIDRQLVAASNAVTVAVDVELNQAAFSRDKRAELQANMEQRRRCRQPEPGGSPPSRRASMLSSAALYRLVADGLAIAAEILAQQPSSTRRDSPSSSDAVTVIPPQSLETFADVGSHGAAKERLRQTIGIMLERSVDAARSGVVHNGILLYGPPGTGKTLLARALAGEYGLRFIRFSPALIASAYQHEPAKKLRQVFALAAEQAPCLLLLDEVDAIAGRREAMVSPDQRELTTQLLNSLEDYRDVPGLVIMAATNTLDQLDPALREGRFDSRIAVPLPDRSARTEVLKVHLDRRGDLVDWEGVDLLDLADRTAGRSGASLAAIVTGAAERAMAQHKEITQADLLAEIEGRSGQDRAQTFEEQVRWEDVVLPEATQRRLAEIMLLFQNAEAGRALGVRPPAGILLYGPPGTGKTTIAKALATEIRASFYEQSGADLLSKWVGESEQKVAQLFTRARNNRPSIIFCDEIDAVLKRRTADSSAPWEERVVSQFLRELDGMTSSEGVLLVGATNRLDIIDDAVRERRLVPIEVPLPHPEGRTKILEVLTRNARVAPDLDLAEVGRATEGMSGADLKNLRDAAGMKALARAAGRGTTVDAAITMGDFAAALDERHPPVLQQEG